MMKATALIAALAAVLLSSNAEARPKHRTTADSPQMSGDARQPLMARNGLKSIRGDSGGCSDPVMRPCETGGRLASIFGEEISKKSLRHRRFLGGRATKEITHHNTAKPRAWCGWWLGRYLGMTDRKLWLARNWAHVGRPAHGPAVGAVVVWARGKRSGHVGIITGKTDRGWVVKSGNDGHAVRERVRSVSNAIAFRWP